MPRIPIPFPPYVNCPHCQARNPATDERCATCGQALTVYIGPAEHFPRRFGLGAVMVLIAVVAVCLGITREVPVLGLLMLAVGVPGLVRTMVWVSRRESDALPMEWSEKLGAFAASVGVVWLILLGAFAAFGLILAVVGTLASAALHAPGNGDAALYISLGPAGIGGVAAGSFLGRFLWPIRD